MALTGWNYLRVRGEYGHAGFVNTSTVELPPRARRIPWGSRLPAIWWGTTSACAENTGGGC